MVIKHSIKLTKETLRYIETVKSAFRGENPRMTNDDVVKMAVQKLMNDFGIKQLEDKQDIDRAYEKTKMLARGVGIKVE